MGNAAIRSVDMTFDSAAHLDPDKVSGELCAGRWVPVTRNTWRHGEVAGNVYLLLRLYAREHPGWSVAVCDPGTKLGHDPDVLRGPDVAVEVLGDSQSTASLEEKVQEYLSAGARLVWLLDPSSAQVTVFTPGGDREVLESFAILDGGEVLPGFACEVGELFALE